jgi:hypothetical protein
MIDRSKLTNAPVPKLDPKAERKPFVTLNTIVDDDGNNVAEGETAYLSEALAERFNALGYIAVDVKGFFGGSKAGVTEPTEEGDDSDEGSETSDSAGTDREEGPGQSGADNGRGKSAGDAGNADGHAGADKVRRRV